MMFKTEGAGGIGVVSLGNLFRIYVLEYIILKCSRLLWV